mmetsp:Transcript_16778/g.43577  ORF Transcript_16778/g.43577 Transcript_16778/m.43577 type:complete len:240 (-) Transcript_16778:294-1013(-)
MPVVRPRQLVQLAVLLFKLDRVVHVLALEVENHDGIIAARGALAEGLGDNRVCQLGLGVRPRVEDFVRHVFGVGRRQADVPVNKAHKDLARLVPAIRDDLAVVWVEDHIKRLCRVCQVPQVERRPFVGNYRHINRFGVPPGVLEEPGQSCQLLQLGVQCAVSVLVGDGEALVLAHHHEKILLGPRPGEDPPVVVGQVRHHPLRPVVVQHERAPHAAHCEGNACGAPCHKCETLRLLRVY